MTCLHIPKLSRRESLQTLAAAGLWTGAGLPWSATALAQAASRSTLKDEDIFQFALNLEYMEAEYYLRATTGKGIDAADLGSDPGQVKGGRKVSFQDKAIREFADELAANELAHVRFYRKTLGRQAVDRPAIDFEAGFAAVGKTAGLPDFDPFASDMNFLLGGMLFSDFWNWRTVGLGIFLFAVARPASVFAGLVRTQTSLRIRGISGWFGVRGIGSMYYLMYAINHGIAEHLARDLIQLTLVVITMSILVHGTSVKPVMSRLWGRRRSSAAGQ